MVVGQVPRTVSAAEAVAAIEPGMRVRFVLGHVPVLVADAWRPGPRTDRGGAGAQRRWSLPVVRARVRGQLLGGPGALGRPAGVADDDGAPLRLHAHAVLAALQGGPRTAPHGEGARMPDVVCISAHPPTSGA